MSSTFSIIIPTLNEESYLPFLLKEISKQTFTDYEVIIVDGKSEDKTREIASSYPRLTLLTSTKRHVSAQRNRGARAAKGTYLLFFDADVRIEPDFLAKLLRQLDKTGADVAVCRTKEISKKTPGGLIYSVINLGIELSKALDRPTALGSQMCFKRSVFKVIRGFNENISYAEDTEIVRRAVKLGYKFEVFKSPRYEYSLRRIETDGLQKSLETYFKLNSKVMQHEYPTKKLKEYPMIGGALYKNGKQKKRSAKKKKAGPKLKSILQKIANQ